MKSRNLEVIHSGMVLLSDTRGSGARTNRVARLILTRDQLTIQISVDATSTNISALPESSFDTTLRTVNVNRTSEGLGLSIKGGSDGTHSVPIVISRVLPKMSAAQTGQIFVGDSIVEINGVPVAGKTHEQVVQMLRQQPLSDSGHVTLTLKHDSQMAPLLRPASAYSIMAESASILDASAFKSALKSTASGCAQTAEIASVAASAPPVGTTPTRRRANSRHHSVARSSGATASAVSANVSAVTADDADDIFNSDQWRTINRIPLPMAIVSRYLWGTDKIRANAFEVRAVDGRTSGVIHCEDRRALDQWLKYIETHIAALNRKSIKMSNKYLHPSERITYIGWVDEHLLPPRPPPTDGGSATGDDETADEFNDRYGTLSPRWTGGGGSSMMTSRRSASAGAAARNVPDPMRKWEQRFIIFKGSDLCVFESPPLNSVELDKCVCLYKVYETALRTAHRRHDRRQFAFILDTAQRKRHYFSVQSRIELQHFESAYYNCVYRAVTNIHTRTFACSYDQRPGGLVIDLTQGVSLYDIPTKRYIWHCDFPDLEGSSDDGKMRIQLIFRDRSATMNSVIDDPFAALKSAANAPSLTQVKDIECDQILFVVFTLHAFYITKIVGADPEYLRSLPLS